MFAFVTELEAAVVVEKVEVAPTERVPVRASDAAESVDTLSVWIFAV